MPRKHRRNPEFFDPPHPGAPPSPRSAPPSWAVAGGFEVRHVQGDKPYRCPGCDHSIRPGLWHLVVVPDGEPDERRHWHTECWRTELRRLGSYRPTRMPDD
jgi:hypothetical protein